MKLFGLSMVRNEADIIGTTIRYHLALGIDRILVIDNGSTDGTDKVLEELASDRVRWKRYDGHYLQGELITQLAREAWKEGADWIVPFDADEFWYAPWGDFREVLSSTGAGGLRAQVIHFVQARDRITSAPDALLTMTYRAPRMIGPPDQCCALVEAQQIAMVEIMYGPKWISRASRELEIEMGNHSVANLAAPAETTGDVVCLHAPYRSRAVLQQKVEHSVRVQASRRPLVYHWHVHRLRRLAQEGQLDREWAANSYEDGALDLYGKTRPLISDMTLHDALAPFITAESSRGATSDLRSVEVPAAAWARRAANGFLTNLQHDADVHTSWGYELAAELDRTRALVAELQQRVDERTEWGQRADHETEQARTALANLQQEFAERSAWALALDEENTKARALIAELQQRLAALAATSR